VWLAYAGWLVCLCLLLVVARAVTEVVGLWVCLLTVLFPCVVCYVLCVCLLVGCWFGFWLACLVLAA